MIQLVGTDGNIAASYRYDPWGRVISATGSMANINPLRYRGYYYDTETGFYYLQSRYYDPTVCRFINADSYASTGQDFLGFNMFAYCGNSPINNVDYTGKFFEELWDAFTAAINSASGYFMAAGTTALADGPEPGPADVAGAVMAAGGLLFCFGSALYTTLTTPSPSVTFPQVDTQVDTKEKEKAITTQPRTQYNYWAAELIGGEVVVSTPLTFTQASIRVAHGGNIMCRNQAAARAIIIINRYRNAAGPEKGCGNNYYWHYHPTRNHTGSNSVHIWFYSEV